MYAIAEITDPAQKSALCDRILRALPHWFGIETAIVDYTRQVADLPLWAALDGAGRAVGFAALKPHTAYAAEVAVMGVLEAHHGGGAGRALIEACVGWCRERGVDYLTVKTLADSHPDPMYAKTRQFYTAMGFVPVEIFPDLWDSANPCLLMVKRAEQPRKDAKARTGRANQENGPIGFCLDGLEGT